MAGFFVNQEDRIVRHHLQAAHNRSGGWEMALRMMACDLTAAREGKPERYGDPDEGSKKKR